MARLVIDCPACGSSRTAIVASLDSERQRRFIAFSEMKFGGLLNDWLNEITVELSRCEGCGHHWYRQQPEPEQLSMMYAAGTPLGGRNNVSREPTPKMNAEMEKIFRIVDGQARISTLLDYGSGFGKWARAAVNAGFIVTAYEPSAQRGAESETPFELVHEMSTLEGRVFCAIQLEQVLEHIPDPLGALSALQAYCDDKTILRVTVPNVLRAPEAGALLVTWPFDGKAPHTLAPFEHLHGFTPRSLLYLARRAGYRSLALVQLTRHAPALLIRAFAGRFIPSFGSTCLYLQKASNRGRR